MAITSSAKKAIRNAARKRVFNLRRKKALQDVVKETRKLALAGKLDEAKAKLPLAFKALDKAAKTHLIKKNNASRKKARLSKLIAGSVAK